MLKVKFMQYKNVVIMEILEQSMGDYENLSEHPFRALNLYWSAKIILK